MIVLLFISLNSCVGPVIKLIYGLHQPRYVSDSDVINYAKKIDWEGDIYRLKDYSEGKQSKYRYLGRRLPEIIVFNSKAQVTSFEINCSSDIISLAELSVEAIDRLETGENSVQDFIADTYVINNFGAKEMTTSNKPIYVVKFADFVGKINKDNVPEQLAILSKRNDIKYVLLNMDYTIKE